jgi:hypothetical protein
VDVSVRRLPEDFFEGKLSAFSCYTTYMNEQLDRIEAKVAEIDAAVNKMRKYMLLSFGVTIFMIVVPGIIFALVLPSAIGALSGGLPAGF